MGIGFVSSLAIEKSLALGLVKTVAIKELKLNRDFYCVYRSKGVISRLLSEFIDFVRTKTIQS